MIGEIGGPQEASLGLDQGQHEEAVVGYGGPLTAPRAGRMGHARAYFQRLPADADIIAFLPACWWRRAPPSSDHRGRKRRWRSNLNRRPLRIARIPAPTERLPQESRLVTADPAQRRRTASRAGRCLRALLTVCRVHEPEAARVLRRGSDEPGTWRRGSWPAR